MYKISIKNKVMHKTAVKQANNAYKNEQMDKFQHERLKLPDKKKKKNYAKLK